jgi:phosphoglycolate phosphatase
LYIIGSNGSDPGESVFIGDGDSDIMTARAAGMNSIAVLWGYRGFQELKEAGAESFASYPGDILELLKTDFNV